MKIAVAVRVRPASGPSTLLAGPLLTSAGGRPDEVRVGTRAFRNWSSVVTGSDQQRAFDQLCTPLLRQLADGYAITFLAYGQTGSGKTLNFFGPPGSLTLVSLGLAGGGVPPAWGLLPRLALELLRAGAGSTLHASAIEVYQDKAYDLLADRAPLTVGTKSAGRKVEGADHGAIVIGNHGGAAGACSSGVGGTAHAGSHPPAAAAARAGRQGGREGRAPRQGRGDPGGRRAAAAGGGASRRRRRRRDDVCDGWRDADKAGDAGGCGAAGAHRGGDAHGHRAQPQRAVEPLALPRPFAPHGKARHVDGAPPAPLCRLGGQRADPQERRRGRREVAGDCDQWVASRSAR